MTINRQNVESLTPGQTLYHMKERGTFQLREGEGQNWNTVEADCNVAT